MKAEYKHHTGEISIIIIRMEGMGNKRVRIAKLPPEVPDNALRAALTPMEQCWTFKRKSGHECTGTWCRMEYDSSR
jgi:hypothetical protein